MRKFAIATALCLMIAPTIYADGGMASRMNQVVAGILETIYAIPGLVLGKTALDDRLKDEATVDVPQEPAPETEAGPEIIIHG